MGERSVAAVAVGGRRSRSTSSPLPDPDDTSGLLRVEACGVCGSDIKKYSATSMRRRSWATSRWAGSSASATAARRWGVEEGDRVLLEEYCALRTLRRMPIRRVPSCSQTDNHGPTAAIRYGSTPVQVPPALWGGYSEYQYSHLTSVIHKVPDRVPSPHAAFALPLSNGIQWTQLDARVGMGDVVVIQGLGQQGIGCLIASKAAGAAQVIVSGIGRDAGRLRLATELGADRVVDVEREDARRGRRGGYGRSARRPRGRHERRRSADARQRRGGRPQARHGRARVRERGGRRVRGPQHDPPQAAGLRGVRGHSYRAVELALQIVGAGSLLARSDRWPDLRPGRHRRCAAGDRGDR